MTDFLEWSFTLIHGAGLVFLALVMKELWQDRVAASPDVLAALGLVNGRRTMWVFMLVRHTGFFFVLQALFFLTGVLAIIRVNPAVAADPNPGLFVVALSLMMDTVTLLDLRDRRRIRDYVPRAVQ